MAVFPCDWSAHRYPGVQRSVYITSVWGEELETAKLRLCQQHFDQELHHIREHMVLVDESSIIGQLCDSCSKEKSAMVFAKVFDKHAEPEYYAADLCAACWQALRVTLKVASGRAMRGPSDPVYPALAPNGPVRF
jgi:hypothetical protein